MQKHLAVIFSDWHVHNYHRFNKDGARLTNCISVLFDIGKFCRKNGIVTVLLAGDVYDNQKLLPTEAVNAIINGFSRFAETFPEITIYAISGNHDYATKNLLDKPAVSALHHLESAFPNTFVIVDNTSVEVAEGIRVWGIPYYEYPEHFDARLTAVAEEVISNIQDNEFDYLMIHQNSKGLLPAFIPCESDPDDKRYENFEYVFAGHIHEHKQLADNYMSVGSPIHRDAADAGHKKGFVVMNLANPSKGYKLIHLAEYPEFIEKYKGDDTVAYRENDYVIELPVIAATKHSEGAKVAEFNTSLKNSDLLTNYWTEVDGQNKKLLEVGLGFLTT